jgi:ThiF family protein
MAIKPMHFVMTATQREALSHHVLPSDGLEAVAVALCGRATSSSREKLIVHRVVEIPHNVCKVRAHDGVTWPTEVLVPLIEQATKKGWGLVKVHGHRGFPAFSVTDDQSDKALFPSLYAWIDSPAPHGSAVLLDDGGLIGRVVTESGDFRAFDQIAVVGDDITFRSGGPLPSIPEHATRIIQSFGKGTFELLRRMRVAVVGVSGTGSHVVEQLARNCVGSLVLVDNDIVEGKNLNRIINASREDALRHEYKVFTAARAIARMGMDTHVETHPKSLFSPEVVRAVASCDVIMGCVDSVEARYLLNKIATFYSIPYIDLGVRLEADGVGGVRQVAGSVHYLQPGGSSLLSRNVLSLEEVRAEGLRRTDPNSYRERVREGYIRGIVEDRPAVVHINGLIASLGVGELLARIHPYRLDANSEFAITRVSLSHGIWDHESDGAPCQVLSRHIGRGDVDPLLDTPELSLASSA